MTYTERLKSYLDGNVVDVVPFDLFDVETPLATNMGYTKIDLINDFSLYTDMVHLKNLYMELITCILVWIKKELEAFSVVKLE